MSNSRINSIREQLQLALSPSYLEIIDESHQHIGHIGAKEGGGHYSLIISATVFEAKPLLECHRMIYNALNNLMTKEIHALKIKVIRDNN